MHQTGKPSRVRSFLAAVFTLTGFAGLLMTVICASTGNANDAFMWIVVMGVSYWLMKVMEK